jgi:hypothetical protein
MHAQKHICYHGTNPPDLPDGVQRQVQHKQHPKKQAVMATSNSHRRQDHTQQSTALHNNGGIHLHRWCEDRECRFVPPVVNVSLPVDFFGGITYFTKVAGYWQDPVVSIQTRELQVV